MCSGARCAYLIDYVMRHAICVALSRLTNRSYWFWMLSNIIILIVSSYSILGASCYCIFDYKLIYSVIVEMGCVDNLGFEVHLACAFGAQEVLDGFGLLFLADLYC